MLRYISETICVFMFNSENYCMNYILATICNSIIVFEEQ